MLKLLQKFFAPDELETTGQPAPRPLRPGKRPNKKQIRGRMGYKRPGTKLYANGAR